MNNVDFSSFLPLVLVFAAMYFFVIRPQSKKAKEHKAMLNALRPRDRVVTSGGLLGSVVSISEREAKLELAPNVTVTILRAMIAEKISGTSVPTPEAETKKAPVKSAPKKPAKKTTTTTTTKTKKRT